MKFFFKHSIFKNIGRTKSIFPYYKTFHVINKKAFIILIYNIYVLKFIIIKFQSLFINDCMIFIRLIYIYTFIIL